MSEIKFEPWNEHSVSIELPKLDIKEPPCAKCKHWNPLSIVMQSRKTGQLEYDGVRLCWVEEMYSDFSCFEEEENED